MSGWLRLARWLPLDPNYAPFGWRALRGLNAFPFALYVPIAFAAAVDEVKFAVTFRGTTPLAEALAEGLDRFAPQLLLGIVGSTPLLVVTIASLNWTAGRPMAWRACALFTALLLGCCLSWPLGITLGHALGLWEWTVTTTPPADAVYAILQQMLFGVAAAVPILLTYRRRDMLGELREAKLQRIQAERRETEGRLQTLRAQIEPHFLFNTLAHIVRLQQVDPRRGREMLQSLTECMRSALRQIRAADYTLGHELALTRAYANIQQIRMGERLRLEFVVDDALLAARLPSMTVLTLAENAVKHGLGPKGEGGTLRVEASLRGDLLEVAVCDDGVGLHLGAGSGNGLSITRSRLAAHGPRAGLDISNRASGGVRAAIVLPYAPVAAVPA